MRYIFFSLRSFDIDVGETVRMYGLLNSLASNGHEVIFISNARRYEMFHTSIKHVFIDYDFKEKRNFQGLLALFPYKFVFNRYKQLFNKINAALQYVDVGKDPVYFFDYLDNSIAYVLKKKGFITKYINDIHGIGTIEFQNHINNTRNFFKKITNKMKYLLAYKLDKKVFEFGNGFIYGSDKMKKYFEGLYDLSTQKAYIIPYLLGAEVFDRKIDDKLRTELQEQLNIQNSDFVILFIGSYKPTAGVDDLISAFDQLCKNHADCKLLLIGSGPKMDDCVKLASELNLKNRVSFISHIPYSQLPTYQSLAKVIVCPDKKNLFSQYIVHIKYLDALSSGKLVINGAFDSVKEINKDDFLSLTFEPSDVNDLYEKLKLCKENFELLTEKYKGTKSYTLQNLIYKKYIGKLLN